MDGTLVDTNFSNYLSYKKAIQSVIPTDTDISYNPTERFNRGLLKRVVPNLTETEYEEIVQLKEEYYKEYLPQTKLNKLVAEILIQYSKTNKTVLVTNCREDRAIITLNYYGLTGQFSSLFFRHFDGDNGKINKFQNAIIYLGISPKLVIAFENEESEIADAMEAGIQYINPIIKINK
jgi:phosphoglycolate phosphatase-like HAD superfamily hydrolase